MKVATYQERNDDLDGAVSGVPAFRTRITAKGEWAFHCTCGKTHTHSPKEGHRPGHCASHRPHGYWLLEPEQAQEDAT